MLGRNSTNFSFPRQIGLLIMLIGGGIIAGSLVSAGVWVMMTGTSLSALKTEMANPAYYYAVITLQAVSTFFVFFLPAWLFSVISQGNALAYTGLRTYFTGRQLMWMVIILALALPLSGALSEMARTMPLPASWKAKFDAMEADREAQEAILIKINSASKYVLSMILIGILPAIFEEILFRGVLQNILTRWFRGPWAAILLTAFIFSIIHLSFYGFFVRFALGVILGFIFYYSGSLWLVILMHFLYNGLQVTALYLLQGQTNSVKDVEVAFPLWAGAAALAAMFVAFRQFKKISWKEEHVFEYKDSGPDDFHDWIAKNS